jgi:hypothetical protein
MTRVGVAASAGLLSAAWIGGAAAQVDSVAISEALAAAMAKAQAEAARPGDESLSCEQMLAELDAVQNAPIVKEKVASLETKAREEVRRAEAAKGAGKAMLAGRAVLGAAVSTRPEAVWINLIAGYVQMAIMTAQANAAAPRAAAMRADLEAIMPNFARVEHLIRLAQDKNCAFLRRAAETSDLPGEPGR